MVLFGADISNHKAGISVPRIVREGYRFIWCKASEGIGSTEYVDPTFDGFVGAIKQQGAIPGGYHFLRAGSGIAQAELFHRMIIAHGGPNGFLCACDTEKDAPWDTVYDFFARWKALTGGHPLFMYSSNWWWGVPSRSWPNGVGLTPLLWDSRYVSGDGYGSKLYEKVPNSWWIPRYSNWPETTVLQFSSTAEVAGFADVDVNAFRGTEDELRQFTRKGSDLALSYEDKKWLVQNNRSAIARGAWQDGYCDATFDEGYRGGPSLETINQKLDGLATQVAYLALSGVDVDAVADAILQKMATSPAFMDMIANVLVVAIGRALVDE